MLTAPADFEIFLLNERKTTLMRTQLLRVEGKGPFPTDMLRYDMCWPSTTDDAITIDSLCSGDTPPSCLVQVELRGARGYSPARWESFGWKVINRMKEG